MSKTGNINFEFTTGLESQETKYENLIVSCRDEVVGWFIRAGFTLESDEIIDRAVIYFDTESARRAMSREFKIEFSKVPKTFGGTVNDKTLFVVSENFFRKTWKKLYPKWPWGPASYRGLIVHELAHRAHARISFIRSGSEDAMGPSWFFEGLAIICAGQFDSGEKPMTETEILSFVGKGKTPEVSYPLYGNLVRSLAETVSLKELVEEASKPGFPEELLESRRKN